jgi:hypothetical protein
VGEKKKLRRWETGCVGERKERNEKSPIIFQNNFFKKISDMLLFTRHQFGDV